jgi:group I intron endonuclease
MIVYCIQNKKNGKKYIGLTKRKLISRWKQHIIESNKIHSWEWNTPLGRAIKKYGKDEFNVFILKECVSVEEMKQKEIDLIKEHKTFVEFGGYNLTKGGDGRFGYKLSEESKKKISLGNIGKIMSEEAKQKMSEAKAGKYIRGNHPKAVKLLVEEKEKFNCIKDFSESYGIPCSTVNNKFRQGLKEFTLRGIKIQRILE